jgi:hypothetical protein
MPKHTLLPDWEQVLSAAARLQQLQIQLANPLPYDLEETRLAEYKNLAPKWQNWQVVKDTCKHCATALFDRVATREHKRDQQM